MTQLSVPLTLHSRIVAAVTHYQCEEWLGQCLESLVAQTRPPEHIVVLDDASPVPPIDIVSQFPGVTLLAASENGGPYRLLQYVVDEVDCDALMIQDADDWSEPHRLDTLLLAAESTGAEVVGSQPYMVHEDGSRKPRSSPFPEDVTAAFELDPCGHFCMFGTMLIARDLVRRLGGFATGLRFGADAEFFRRASHVTRMINVRDCCYNRRVRPGSLTQHPDTGMQSPARLEQKAALVARAIANATARQEGRAPDLSPFRVASPSRLLLVSGPGVGRVRRGGAAVADRQ